VLSRRPRQRPVPLSQHRHRACRTRADRLTAKFDGSSQTSPITGGTGEFLGATGEVTARVLSGAGDFVIAITK